MRGRPPGWQLCACVHARLPALLFLHLCLLLLSILLFLSFLPFFFPQLVNKLIPNRAWGWVATLLILLASAANLCAVNHVVQDGESLQSIADQHGVSASSIADLNRRELSGSSAVRPGMNLLIPATPPKKRESEAVYQRYDEFRTASTTSKGIPGRKTLSSTQGDAAKIPPIAAPAAPSEGETVVEAPRMKLSERPSDSDAKSEINVTSEGGIFNRRYRYLGRAKASIDAADVERGRWRIVVLHHSETQRGNARLFDHFHRRKRGMKNGLAYHFVIGNGTDSRDGEIEIGPRWREQKDGGHVRSRALNAVSIGICFVGDFNHSRPTKKQIAACIELVKYLRRRCDTRFRFALHREINPHPTDCPGKYFPGRLFHQMFD
ncbi:hypothetical protein DB346_11960 [Verrucomicrobia bacterium LW23]|nr:hypothetical protein DB346_11960 [Verrucomicrobia bacterium LW23]